METGAFDEAQQCLAAVLAPEPGHQVAILNIARIDQRLGRFEAAADAYRSLREAGANDPEIDLGLAACLQELDRLEEALALYRELLEREPSLYPRNLRSLTGASRGMLPLRAERPARTPCRYAATMMCGGGDDRPPLRRAPRSLP